MWAEVLDQSLHFLWAGSALATFYFIRIPVLDGVLGALLLALPRELVDQWPIERPWDTVLDLSFFVLGGIAVGLARFFYERRDHHAP